MCSNHLHQHQHQQYLSNCPLTHTHTKSKSLKRSLLLWAFFSLLAFRRYSSSVIHLAEAKKILFLRKRCEKKRHSVPAPCGVSFIIQYLLLKHWVIMGISHNAWIRAMRSDVRRDKIVCTCKRQTGFPFRSPFCGQLVSSPALLISLFIVVLNNWNSVRAQ